MRKNVFLQLSIIIPLTASTQLRTFQNNDHELISEVITKTFEDVKCLNFFLNQNLSKYYDAAHLFKMDYTFINIATLNEANIYCGYIFLSENFFELDHLKNFSFNLIPRILYIVTQKTVHIPELYHEKKQSFQDKDFVILDLSISNYAIYKQERHFLRLENIFLNFSKTFFRHPSNPQTSVNYEGRLVKVTTFHCPVFNNIIENGNEQDLGDGVETRIFKEIVKKLNLKWKVIPDDGKRWGTAYANKTISGGILKRLHSGEADMGFCSLWIEQSKFPYIVMSGYWNILCLRFLVPKPKIMSNYWGTIFKPLPLHLWIMIFFSTVITSVFSSLLNRVQRYIKTDYTEKTGIISSFITIIGTLFMTKNPNKYEGSNATKHLFLWWSIFGLIITTVYSSSLVSHLTYPQHHPMLDTVEALVKANYYWGTPYEPPIKYIFNKNNSWHRTFADSFKYETNSNDRTNRILAGNYSVFVKCIGNMHFMEVHDVPNDILHELRASRNCLNYFYLGFGFRKALPYYNAANRIIATLVESGITEYWLNRLFEKEYSPTTFARIYEYKIPPEDVQLQPLTLNNLRSVFFVLFAGGILSTFTFIGEIITKNF